MNESSVFVICALNWWKLNTKKMKCNLLNWMRSLNSVCKMCYIDTFVKKHLYRLYINRSRWKHDTRLLVLFPSTPQLSSIFFLFFWLIFYLNLYVVITIPFDWNRHLISTICVVRLLVSTHTSYFIQSLSLCVRVFACIAILTFTINNKVDKIFWHMC